MPEISEMAAATAPPTMEAAPVASASSKNEGSSTDAAPVTTAIGFGPANTEDLPEIAKKLIDLISGDLHYVKDASKGLKNYGEKVSVEIKEVTETLKNLKSLDPTKHNVKRLRDLEKMIINLKMQIPARYKPQSDARRRRLWDEAEGSHDMEKFPDLFKNKTLELSLEFKDFMSLYDTLKPDRKVCLLSFSIFPENEIIRKRFMVYWWMAEGFVKPKSGEESVEKTAEELAGEIFQELMEKDFIQPFHDKPSLEVKLCKMHPFVRSALVIVARRANAFHFDSAVRDKVADEAAVAALIADKAEAHAKTLADAARAAKTAAAAATDAKTAAAAKADTAAARAKVDAAEVRAKATAATDAKTDAAAAAKAETAAARAKVEAAEVRAKATAAADAKTVAAAAAKAETAAARAKVEAAEVRAKATAAADAKTAAAAAAKAETAAAHAKDEAAKARSKATAAADAIPAHYWSSHQACLFATEIFQDGPEIGKIHILFNVDEIEIDFEKPDTLFKMESLNILCLGRWQHSPIHHIELEDIKHLEGLKNMKFLKFLSLQGVSRIMELPGSIFCMPNLAILDLRACHSLEQIPKEIGQLKSLTHLDMSECYLLESMPKEISELKELQVLKGFVVMNTSEDPEKKEAKHCTIKLLAKLTKLRKLSIHTGRNDFPDKEERKHLNQLKFLLKLTIAWGRGLKTTAAGPKPPQETTMANTKQGQEGAEGLSKPSMKKILSKVLLKVKLGPDNDAELPTKLEKLDLQSFPEVYAPEWLQASKLTNLKKLYIRGGTLRDLGQNAVEIDRPRWNKVETLRVKYLKRLEMDWRELQDLFPKLTYLEKVDCPKLTLFPCDGRGIWKKNPETVNQL